MLRLSFEDGGTDTDHREMSRPARKELLSARLWRGDARASWRSRATTPSTREVGVCCVWSRVMSGLRWHVANITAVTLRDATRDATRRRRPRQCFALSPRRSASRRRLRRRPPLLRPPSRGRRIGTRPLFQRSRTVSCRRGLSSLGSRSHCGTTTQKTGGMRSRMRARTGSRRSPKVASMRLVRLSAPTTAGHLTAAEPAPRFRKC